MTASADTDVDVRCAQCGAVTSLPARDPRRAFGSPDLDTRPGGAARGAIARNVQRCAACGYCARDLQSLVVGAGEGIAQPEYRELLVDATLPDTSRAYLCCAYLEAAAGRFDDALWSTLSAAWIADDERADEAAERCRTMAVTALRLARAAGRPVGEQPGVEDLLEADLLRRTGRFADAAVCIRRALRRPQDEVVGQVLRFQLDLVTEQDRAAHSVIEALQGDR